MKSLLLGGTKSFFWGSYRVEVESPRLLLHLTKGFDILILAPTMLVACRTEYEEGSRYWKYGLVVLGFGLSLDKVKQ
jgi:hypothetical protein